MYHAKRTREREQIQNSCTVPSIQRAHSLAKILPDHNISARQARFIYSSDVNIYCSAAKNYIFGKPQTPRAIAASDQ